jgi:hypothetical protein
MKIVCSTLFDITATGITGHFKPSRIPFTDLNGNVIHDEPEWHRARNQQRNWETISQLISLRTQVFNISTPIMQKDRWVFTFEVDAPGIFGTDLTLLIADCSDVPMITGLDELPSDFKILASTGTNQNIWFEEASINIPYGDPHG